MPQVLYTTLGGAYPLFSPNGRYVLAGNGILKLIDLDTQTETRIAASLSGFLRGGWYSDDCILIQDDDWRVPGDGTGSLYQYSVASGVLAFFWMPWDHQVDVSPTYRGDQFRVSQGHWALCASGTRLCVDGREFGPGHYSMDLSDEVCAANFGTPSRVRVITLRDFSVTDVAPQVGPNIVRASGGDVTYGYSGRSLLRLMDGRQATVNLTPRESPAKVVRDPGGQRWVVTAADMGEQSCTLVRPIGHVQASAIVLDSGAVRLDAVALGDRVRVATDLTNGRLTIFEARFDDPLVALPVVLVPIAPFDFPTAVAWFFEDSKRPSVTPSPAPGQWSIIVESGLRPPKPVLIGLSGDLGEDLIAEWAGRWPQVRGIYVDEEASRAGLQRQARIAVASMKARGLPRRPIYSYSAGNLWTDISEINVLGVQCYPEPGELAASMTARWRPRCLKVQAAGKRLSVVAGFYDRRPLKNVSAETILTCLDVCVDLAREFEAPMLCFAWGRQGGAASLPSLWPGLQALAAAVVTTPRVEIILPKVTIVRYQDVVRVGQGARAVAGITQGADNAQKFLWRYRKSGQDWIVVARNPVSDTDHTFFRDMPAGVYYIGVDVTDLTGTITNGTQQERKVTIL